jgi:hypothetical protein
MVVPSRAHCKTGSPESLNARVRSLLPSLRPSGTVSHGIAEGEKRMSFSLSVGPVVALIAGILILIMPRLLNYIIALYLIIIGVLGLMGEPRGRVGADAGSMPPAAVQRAVPDTPGTVIDI